LFVSDDATEKVRHRRPLVYRIWGATAKKLAEPSRCRATSMET
jgi:hypothetical protein